MNYIRSIKITQLQLIDFLKGGKSDLKKKNEEGNKIFFVTANVML